MLFESSIYRRAYAVKEPPEEEIFNSEVHEEWLQELRNLTTNVCLIR
jgi:hypothetical protein